jgi:Cu+-exporting ATPase
MFIPWNLLHDPFFQLVASLPVYIVGFSYFGRSAYHSVKNGVPNMDVLIFVGSFSAFVYSIAGLFMFFGIIIYFLKQEQPSSLLCFLEI